MTSKTPETHGRTDGKKGKSKKPFFVMPVNSCISAVLCVAGLISSGAISLYREEASQDRTMTVEQILARRKDTAERLKNDPHVPAQAKAIMLSQLGHPRDMAPKQAAPTP